MAQEARRLAEMGLSEREIAKRLGVSKSTVTRWKAAGKLRKVRRKTSTPPEVAATAGKTPAEWAKTVRETYALDATDDQLVTLAESALAMSLDRKVGASVRMTAAGRFQALVRQLALVARNAPAEQPAPAEEPKRKHVVRRPGRDPRAILMAVK